MATSTILLILAGIFVANGIAAAIAIGAVMQRRGHQICWPLYRVLMIKWVHRYHEENLASTGQAGFLFWWFIVGMNGGLALTIAGFLVLALA
jgi:hypothetical protein